LSRVKGLGMSINPHVFCSFLLCLAVSCCVLLCLAVSCCVLLCVKRKGPKYTYECTCVLCCSVLQRVAACCSVLQRVVHICPGYVYECICVLLCCSVVWHVVACCSVFPCVAVCCSVSQIQGVSMCIDACVYWWICLIHYPYVLSTILHPFVLCCSLSYCMESQWVAHMRRSYLMHAYYCTTLHHTAYKPTHCIPTSKMSWKGWYTRMIMYAYVCLFDICLWVWYVR